MWVLLVGGWKLNPCEAANNMLEAIKLFTQSDTIHHLKLVRIVIFEQKVMETFRECFLEKVNTSRTSPPVFPSRHTGTGETQDLGYFSTSYINFFHSQFNVFSL